MEFNFIGCFTTTYMINGNIMSYKRSRVEIIDLICHLK